MNMQIEERLNRLIVSIDGPLDVMSAPTLLTELSQVLTFGAHNLILDMGRVTFIDNAGTSALVSLLRKARGAGRVMALTQLTREVDLKLRLRSLDSVFEIYPDPETALLRL